MGGRARHERVDAAGIKHAERVLDQFIEPEVAVRRLGVPVATPVEVQDPAPCAAQLGDAMPACSARAPTREKDERRVPESQVVVGQAGARCR